MRPSITTKSWLAVTHLPSAPTKFPLPYLPTGHLLTALPSQNFTTQGLTCSTKKTVMGWEKQFPTLCLMTSQWTIKCSTIGYRSILMQLVFLSASSISQCRIMTKWDIAHLILGCMIPYRNIGLWSRRRSRSNSLWSWHRGWLFGIAMIGRIGCRYSRGSQSIKRIWEQVSMCHWFAAIFLTTRGLST